MIKISENQYEGYCNVAGADLYKFYNRPKTSSSRPGTMLEELLDDILSEDNLTKNTSPKQFVSKSIQTDYRESEAQTEPWDPPYKIISKSNKEPEVLALKHFTFGNGLPIRDVEFDYLVKSKHGRISNDSLRLHPARYDSFENTEYDQLKNEYSYRVGVENERQLEKLESMNRAAIEDLLNRTSKKDCKLKNLWTQTENIMQKRNIELEENLRKELVCVDSYFLNKKDPSALKSRHSNLEKPMKQKKIEMEDGKSYMLQNYYLTKSNVESWLEERPANLTIEIPLARTVKKNAREKLIEQAYKSVLVRKKPQIPHKKYREDYVKEEVTAPKVQAEDLNEFINFDEQEEKDEITVLQQSLRGLALQKQMSDLIDHHKDGLSGIISPLLNSTKES